MTDTMATVVSMDAAANGNGDGVGNVGGGNGSGGKGGDDDGYDGNGGGNGGGGNGCGGDGSCVDTPDFVSLIPNG